MMNARSLGGARRDAAACTLRDVLDRVAGRVDAFLFRGAREEDEEEASPSRPSILPKNFLVEFVAGTFGPSSSGRGLMGHLEGEERLRRVVTRTNVGIMAAQDLEENSLRKLEDVQVTRAVKFKHAIALAIDHLETSARRDQDRPYVIREIFGLDESPLAQEIAGWIADSRFLERLAEASEAIPEAPLAKLRSAPTAAYFESLEERFRKELTSSIPEYEVGVDGRRQSIEDDKVLKIVNRIFDAFAPRMILIGHSQGGLVALRAMQLGMRQVRVQDKRRFLYSPRSKRVHRYSPVALAIGLGAPFDGIERSAYVSGNEPGDPLDEDSLPCLVRRLMPGAGQMLRGSRFLTTLRGAFIPFDCSAISIANPRDGVVPLEGTRLPVGDFRNMHNLEVASTGRFDVADVAPEVFRASLDRWPATTVRRWMNESERFEGLREHCSFLFDLGENWDVDKGKIVRTIFSEANGESLFDEMMFEVNFEGLREQLMANLLYRLRSVDAEERRRLAWMAPRLRQMIEEETLPFHNSLDKRAAVALMHIEPH